jgi:CspA family cold shock protein
MLIGKTHPGYQQYRGVIPINTQKRSVVIMATGHVKWFNEKKGYGFIEEEGGKEIFVHYSGITGDGYRNLYEGQSVEFDVEQGDKGPKAVNVKAME